MQVAAWSLLVLLTMSLSCVSDVYQVRSLSEGELLRVYERMLLDSYTFSNREWHACVSDPAAGYWGDGVSAGNQGIRAISDVVLTSASLIKYARAFSTAERKEALRKAVAAVRYCTTTHVTGSAKCVDGKQWGNSWQSGMWVGTLAFGAWLIWEELDPQLRQDFERVVAFEADRFLGRKPPSGRWSDSKAEENGWDLTCISIAANMFPSHPHAGDWKSKAAEYMVNVLSVAQDRQDKTVIDGHPVCDWNCTENMHPDFTLENHGILHPSYIQCSSYFLAECAMHARFAKQPVPEAASHHLLDTWRMFQTILLPSGETMYPQGQDWELHGLNPIQLFAALATWKRDPLASKTERINVQYMRAWQQWCGGSLAAPGSRLGFTRHAIQGEQATWAYLAHKIFGPATDAPVPSETDFVKHYLLVDVIMHRTKSKLVTMSWKNRFIGQVAPIGEGHEASPFFTLPVADGLIGSISCTDAKENKAIKVVGRASGRTANGFETAGRLTTNGGALSQELKIASVGEKTVVYQDRVTALADVSASQEVGAPLGIENDQISGGVRTVYHTEGKTTFDWQKPQQPVAIPGRWANVDGRLGIIAIEGSGLGYIQAQGYNAQGVYADVLCGSFSGRAKSYREGEQVARRITIILTEVTPEETAALAEVIRIEGNTLRLTLPEGGEAEITLL